MLHETLAWQGRVDQGIRTRPAVQVIPQAQHDRLCRLGFCVARAVQHADWLRLIEECAEAESERILWLLVGDDGPRTRLPLFEVVPEP